MLTPGQENLIEIQRLRGELLNSLDKQRAFQRRFTFALALTACMSIGLSLLSLILGFG
jgi:hypothetical protein